MKTNAELYFSTDIETNGPIPSEYSMLSFGSAVFLRDKRMVGTFYSNLKEIPDAKQHKNTMEFWAKNREAYELTRKDQENPEDAMKRYVKWVDDIAEKHNAKPVFVAYPAGFDFLFMYYYLIRFAEYSPFSFSALDIKSYASAKLGMLYKDSTKKNMPKEWLSKTKHTHQALDDAIEQGELFINMLNDKQQYIIGKSL